MNDFHGGCHASVQLLLHCDITSKNIPLPEPKKLWPAEAHNQRQHAKTLLDPYLFFLIGHEMHAIMENPWSIKLNISDASLYRPSMDADSNIASIPPMLRRRLSPLARMVFQVAYAVQPGSRPTRFVFGSRHGEINSCLNMLELLAHEQALSPAAFSHSVHNAIAGLWSIHNGYKGESSAISAGTNTFAMACLEAQLLLADAPETPVIIVIADEKLPNLFAQFEKEPPEPYAMALLLESGRPNLQLNASTRTHPPSQELVSNQPACDWYRWWSSQSMRFEQAGERHEWLWQRLP